MFPGHADWSGKETRKAVPEGRRPQGFDWGKIIQTTRLARQVRRRPREPRQST